MTNKIVIPDAVKIKILKFFLEKSVPVILERERANGIQNKISTDARRSS